MEVGELKITGSIDSLNIEKGINGIILDMKKVSEKSQSVNSDFERMNSNATRLATALGMIGASDALINLAKQSPQVAGDMASIQMSMLQLGLAVGQALKPAFDWFAQKLNNFVSWVQANPDAFGNLALGITALGVAAGALTIGAGLVTLFGFLNNPVILTVVAALWDAYNAFKAISDLASGKPTTPGKDIGSLVGGIGLAIAGGVAGFAVGGPVGAALGASAGYAGGSYLGGKVGGLFDTSDTTGDFYSGEMSNLGYTTQQQTAIQAQQYIDAQNRMNQAWSRRTMSMNMSSLNVGY